MIVKILICTTQSKVVVPEKIYSSLVVVTDSLFLIFTIDV